MSSVEEIRADRPPEPGVARALLIVAVLLWFPVLGYLYSSSVGMVALAMFFAVFGSFGAVKGQQAGRIMTTVALAVVVLVMLPYCWLGFEDPYLNGTAYALMDIASVLLSGTAIALLYHPNTNRYVRQVTMARAGQPT
jgi:hypothetical protein